MFRNILVPTDGSAFSEKVVGPALELAQAMHACVTGVYVYPRYRISPYGEFGPRDDLVEAQVREHAEADGAEYLDRIEAAASEAGVPCERVLVEENDVWKALLDTAEEKGCDLIVMATREPRGGLTGLLLGSETRRVLDHAKVPVMVFH